MHNRIKSYFGGLIVDSLGMPITMIIGILVTPLLFNYISVGEFGYWATILDLTNFLNILNAGIGVLVVQTIAREVASRKKDAHSIFSSLTVFQLILAVVLLLVCLGLFIISPNFGDTSNQFSDFHFFIILVGVYITLNSIWGFQNQILYGQNKITLSNTFALIQKLLMQLLPLGLLMLGLNLIAFPLSYIAIGLILLTTSFIFVRPFLKENFSIQAIRKKQFHEITTFSYRSILGGTSYYVLHFTDTLVIANFLSSASVTVYVLTMKLSNFAKFIPGKIISIAFPSIAQLIAEENYERLSAVSAKLFSVGLRIGLFSAAIIIFLNDLFVRNWVGGDKFGGLILSYMSAAICFRESVVLVFTNIIYSTREIKTINYILFFEAISNIVLSIVLLKFLDIEGVALATILSSCFLSVGYAWYKATKIIHAPIYHFFLPLLTTILRFLPTIAMIWIGRYYLAQYFSWVGFIGVAVIAGFTNVICFEGSTIIKYRKLSLKEIILKVINET